MINGFDTTLMSTPLPRSNTTSRRLLLRLPVALAALHIAPALADAASDKATGFIDKLSRDLTQVVNGPQSTADKAAALRKLIDANVDVDGVARFCLGRFWRTATPDEQKQYLALFHQVLVNNITGKVGDYAGVQITVQRATAREDGIAVTTAVTRPNDAPNKVDWLVNLDGPTPLVTDVIAEGTSLRLTQRNDYSAFLTRNNNSVAALIQALKQQAGN